MCFIKLRMKWETGPGRGPFRMMDWSFTHPVNFLCVVCPFRKKKKQKNSSYLCNTCTSKALRALWLTLIYIFLSNQVPKHYSLSNIYFFTSPYLYFLPLFPFFQLSKIFHYIYLFVFSIHFVVISTHPADPIFTLGNDDTPMTTTITTQSINICWTFAVYQMLLLSFFPFSLLCFSPSMDTFALYFE